MFRRLMDCSNTNQKPASFYSGEIFKQYDGNIVAQPLDCCDYILYYDIMKHHYHAVHISGKRTFEDGVPDVDPEDMTRSFMDDAVPLNDYLLLLYFGDYDTKVLDDPDYCGRILVIDWEGNLKETYILHNLINRFAYDETKHLLYGANFFTGKLYSFDMSLQ